MTALSIFYTEKLEAPSFAFFTKLATAFNRSRTISALRSLSDAQLHDIGVERANITTYVKSIIK